MVVSKKSETVKVEKKPVDTAVKNVIEPVVASVQEPAIANTETVETAPTEVPYIAPEAVVVASTPIRPVTQFKYADSPFPETCTWLDAHGLDPEVVGIGGISKGGYRNLMDGDRNWPFTAREVDELWAIYEAELNASDEEDDTVGE